jgi:HSP20 family protein
MTTEFDQRRNVKMSISRIDPMQDIVSLRDAMDRLFQDSFIRPSNWTGLSAGAIAVPCDLWETKDSYQLRADVPGLSPEDVQIEATAQGVTIAGEIKGLDGDAGSGWLRQERRTGRFERAFAFAVEIDPNKVEASCTNGVLELTLPKAESVKPKFIKVQPRQGRIAQRTEGGAPGMKG